MGKRFRPGQSLRWAGQGILRSIRTERNLRIHLTLAGYVTALGLLAELDGGRWAAILLCFGAVIGAELFNTALETLCDAVHPAQHPQIGAAKDAAAGAVLVVALASAGVGAVLFLPWILDGGLLRALAARRWCLPVALLSLLPAGLFITLPARRKSQNKQK